MPKTYYELFDLPVKAGQVEIHATFRRYVARFRPLLTVPQLFGDARFCVVVNAYLVLHGPLRGQYDALLREDSESPLPPAITGQLEGLNALERNLLLARIAIWRREMMEATHLLRLMVEQHADCAAAWSLQGELHLVFGRLAEAIKAYQRASNLDANNTEYAKRLQHLHLVLAGKVELQLEASPAEDLLREERRRRWRFAALLAAFGVVVLVFSFLAHPRIAENLLNMPWRTVLLQATGVMLVFAGLGYGRVLRPFEEEMVWSTMSAVERGMPKSYPLGLILVVLSVASLWLAAVGFIIIALLEEEWPYSSLILLGLAALINIGLCILLGALHHPFGSVLLFGGNLLCLAGMLGWWVGSFGLVSE